MSRRKNSSPVRSPQYHRWLIGVGILTAAGAVGFLSIYFYINAQVTAWLEGGARHQGGFYSPPTSFTQKSRTEIEKALLERGYVQRETEPISPGDFRKTSTGLEIFSRKYLRADGGETKEQKISWEPDQDTAITLDPLRIAPLDDESTQMRSSVPLHAIPTSLQHAFLAIEDRRFYEHIGVDFFGILRAFVTNMLHGGVVQGGSTITQQLAKNLFFSSSRTITRKVLEMFAALSLERHLSKDRILEEYLNEIYFGQEGSIAIHGVSAAAERFFNKPLEAISLSEAALLAGLVKAPSSYNPRRFPDRALERRNLVLTSMKADNWITEEEFQRASKDKIIIQKKTIDGRAAPYFFDAIRRELAQKHSLSDLPINTSIMTGLSPELQRCAEQAITQGLAALEKQFPRLARRKRAPLQASLLAMVPHNGLVSAYVGGRDYRINQFDRASQSIRPIGSTVKPFVYLTALDESLNRYKTATAISILSDEPTTITLPEGGEWNPENFDQSYRGDVTVRFALEQSLNIPAVQIGLRVGFDTIAQVVENFGVQTKPKPYPALALGAVDSTLLKLTASYAALANGGVLVPPRFFSSVVSPAGELIASQPMVERRVASEAATYVLTDIMRGVIERGTGKQIRARGFKGEAAGKTGTTNDARDAWFVGFTPSLAAGVWVGFDDNTPVGLTGGVGAAPIWGEFMKCAHNHTDLLSFIPPSTVSLVTLDPQTYERLPPGSSGVSEVFVRGTEPP